MHSLSLSLALSWIFRPANILSSVLPPSPKSAFYQTMPQSAMALPLIKQAPHRHLGTSWHSLSFPPPYLLFVSLSPHSSPLAIQPGAVMHYYLKVGSNDKMSVQETIPEKFHFLIEPIIWTKVKILQVNDICPQERSNWQKIINKVVINFVEGEFLQW